MGLLGVEEQCITGAQGYYNGKSGKREVHSWTILEKILGLHQGRDTTVCEIIVVICLEIHIRATAVSTTVS